LKIYPHTKKEVVRIELGKDASCNI
jgi:hypothetical protein